MKMQPVVGGRRVVRCTVGDETYCLDSEWLDSIQVMDNLYPSRGSDGAIGWIRRFDEKVPVYRLADQIQGGNRGPTRQGVIMVLKRNNRSWALLVDKVLGAEEVPEEHVFPLPAVVGDPNGQFPSVIVDQQGLTLYLAPDRVVPRQVSGTSGIAAPVPRDLLPPAPTTRSWIRGESTTQKPSSPNEEFKKEGRQILTFTLDHEQAVKPPVRFAVSAGQALEIVSEPPMISIPSQPQFVTGLASWRAMPIPVVDLGSWFGMTPAPYRPGCRLLLCRGTIGTAKRNAAIVAIAAVDDIRKLDLPIDYKEWPDPVSWNPSLALGVYRAERSLLVIPDLDAILRFQASTGEYAM